MEAAATYIKPYVAKSPDQKLVELAAEQFASKIKEIFGMDASVEIKIKGAPLGKMLLMAKFLRDDEGDEVKVRHSDSPFDPHYYLYRPFEGYGYKIEEVRE